MIDSIYSAASFSTPPRSIGFNNRLPSPPPLVTRNGQVSRHHILPAHGADASGSDTNMNRNRSGSNRATTRPTTRFNLEACMAQLSLDDVPPTPAALPNAIPPLQVDDAEMADVEEEKEEDDEEVAGINNPPLLSFRRSGIDINFPQLSSPNQLRRISLSPRLSPSSLSNKL